MATPWNILPNKIALAPSVYKFKSRQDSYLGKIRGKARIYT